MNNRNESFLKGKVVHVGEETLYVLLNTDSARAPHRIHIRISNPLSEKQVLRSDDTGESHTWPDFFTDLVLLDGIVRIHVFQDEVVLEKYSEVGSWEELIDSIEEILTQALRQTTRPRSFAHAVTSVFG